MDEYSGGSSKIYNAERPKLNKTLHLFDSLKMTRLDLYYEFLPYVLTNDELKQNGFPIENSRYPGHLAFPTCGNRTYPYRNCQRCGVDYLVSQNVEDKTRPVCIYHPKKMSSVQGVPGAGHYLCCNGNYMSKGCKTCKVHVSAEHFLDDVIFQKVRGKKQVRGGETCAVFSLDCEMCYTKSGLEVTKIAVVGVDGLAIYETFVLPESEIIDYNTTYSGITASDLKGVTTTLNDVQAFLLKLFNKDSILVGHGLENDLKALHLIHEKVVDTSVIFPHKYGGLYKRSLKSLVKEFLNSTIQDSDKGHDCIEDARACMELMLLKISVMLEDRTPIRQDENKNSFLQNCPSQISVPWVSARISLQFEPDFYDKNGRLNGYQFSRINNYPKLYKLYPEAHEKYPNVHELYPKVHDLYPKVDDLYSKVHDLYPNVHELYPEVHAEYPELHDEYLEVHKDATGEVQYCIPVFQVTNPEVRKCLRSARPYISYNCNGFHVQYSGYHIKYRRLHKSNGLNAKYSRLHRYFGLQNKYSGLCDRVMQMYDGYNPFTYCNKYTGFHSIFCHNLSGLPITMHCETVMRIYDGYNPYTFCNKSDKFHSDDCPEYRAIT